MRFVALLLAAALCSGVSGWATSHQKAFNAEVWQAGQPDDLPVRVRMVDDLVRRHAFTGERSEDVTALLGESDNAEKWPAWDLSYWVGPVRGWSPEEAGWLLMRVKDGRVSEVLRVTPPYTDEKPLPDSNPSLEELERSL